MNRDRWARIDALYRAAQEREPAERPAFLRDACAGDESLLREVESLLAEQPEAGGILEAPAAAPDAKRQAGGGPGFGVIAPGTRLGPYEIVAPLGAGGMGAVYTAHDGRLDRMVAIKVLHPEVSADPERRARFEREAKTIAGLSHPNICTLYDVGDHEGSRFLVMEYLVGETLAARLDKGPLPIDQVLPLAAEIADALAAAHRRGVVHRDLKPANVMLTRTGARLMDFGLAKLRGHGEQPAVGQLSAVPTRSAPLTGEGVILGTLQYMAPEQVEGKPADARADIWALGLIVFEMVTGRRAFEAASAASLIGAILEREPVSIATLQPMTPPALDRLVRKCLTKDPETRWASAHDVADELRWIAQGSGTASGAVTPHPPPSAHRPNGRTVALAAVALAAAAVAGAALFEALRPAPDPVRAVVARTLVDIRPADQIVSGALTGGNEEGRPGRTEIALAPDGQSLVFSAARGGTQQLFRRAIDRFDAVPIEGTEEATGPFFSPDGEWVGFWSGGSLKKVPIRGGPPTPICGTPPIFGASWGPDDTIVYAVVDGGLLRVPAAGGAPPKPATTLDAARREVSHRLPQFLPGGQAVVFTVLRDQIPKWNETELVVESLETHVRKPIGRGADARYVAAVRGLVFLREGTLLLVPFDPTQMAVNGGAISVLTDVMQAAYMSGSGPDSGAGQFSVSASGTLAYVTGGVKPDAENTLVWVDRAGRTEALPLASRPYYTPRLSPDDRRLVVFTGGSDRNVWVYDIARNAPATLTTEGRNQFAIWSPDGTRVAYAGGPGPWNLFWRAADGSGGAERLCTSGRSQVPISWSPAGELVFNEFEFRHGGLAEAFILEPTGDRKPRPVLQDQSNATGPTFSPDGKWLAYVSTDSRQRQVYVQPYPGPGGRVQVSTNGGSEPVWSRDGRELFYLRRARSGEPGEREMVAVAIATRPTISPGEDRVLFRGRFQPGSPAASYDVSLGKRFLMVQVKERPPLKVTQINLVQNWVEELKARMQAR
jgi:eukaryotic-like serine/threonine-protein kinase